MSDESAEQGTVAVHQAGSWTEFVVIRGLLRSAGIDSLPPNVADPYPMRQPPKGWQSLAIVVRESEAEEARRIISEHLASGALPLPEESLPDASPETDESEEPPKD